MWVRSSRSGCTVLLPALSTLRQHARRMLRALLRRMLHRRCAFCSSRRTPPSSIARTTRRAMRDVQAASVAAPSPPTTRRRCWRPSVWNWLPRACGECCFLVVDAELTRLSLRPVLMAPMPPCLLCAGPPRRSRRPTCSSPFARRLATSRPGPRPPASRPRETLRLRRPPPWPCASRRATLSCA
ncbi:hypothetical protein FA09DRAFT_149612 [Tilletiopsis washingtonensis]|uniref:Uncharacterized protein n=1 Tax=Tilletiopsis washingtonensis TaxID=58919 RepID=A0A316Z1I0_9BASI|nr:hypothetical protein FA09DRAFT_149612 [Tilletiopsis washingtonensis]PWN95391.1 hypothetical protein FA09DRAFT_149612 [Tilletiopsis washingtonensis]